MIYSMTGYGRGEAEDDRRKITVEIRTVNNRYLDIVTRLPRDYRDYLYLEERIRKVVQERISRGRVDIQLSIDVEKADDDIDIKINEALAKKYNYAIIELAEMLGIDESSDCLRFILAQPGVLELGEEEEDVEKLWEVIEKALRQALDNLVSMKAEEAKILRNDLIHRLERVEQLIKEVELRQPAVIEEYRQRLTKRVEELLSSADCNLDKDRIALEVAVFAERSCIAEEIVRMMSHISQFRKALDSQSPVGRKLDFIIQEMNREVNTIGSKSTDRETSIAVVELKDIIEKIREQVQNIE